MQEKLGERIRELRGTLSIGEFSDMFSIHRNTLPAYENGKTSPNAKFLTALCEKYNVQPNWLLMGEGTKYKGESQQPAKTAENGNGSQLNRFEDSLITEIRNFMNELGRKDPDWRTWFKMELLDKIPKFREWWEAKHHREGEDISNKSNAA
jgi:transcriptional regulator with XRE-family HTH domain